MFLKHTLSAILLVGSATMGNGQSSPLQTCLDAVCGDREGCVGYPNSLLYQIDWVKRYNLDIEVEPAAVFRPDTALDVADAVKCAADNGVHVQAKSGGHSYANFCTGGDDGALMIDLVNLKSFSIDNSTWHATLGAGFRLGEIDEKLHDHGGRAMAHGVCPGVGIGGHATVGGIGPMSRMWGTALDHVLEVEVVTADGKIRRASETDNSDLFWALRGAGASFGIITEFVVKTHPEPGQVVEYTYHLSFGAQKDMAPVYKKWQDLVGDPDMDERFSSMFISFALGAIVTGTFYGTHDEYEATGIPDKLPVGGIVDLKILDWLAHLSHQAEVEALYLSDLSTAFDSKSLAFREEDLPSEKSTDELFTYMGSAEAGTLAWFVIWDTQGGAISKIDDNSTAYPHRDKILMYQSYAVGIPILLDATRDFVDGIHARVQEGSPDATSTYAGYVDPDITRAEGQHLYWVKKLPELRRVKREWDPDEVFRNPQSVQPAEDDK